jgi:hypothetical protein
MITWLGKTQITQRCLILGRIRAVKTLTKGFASEEV